MSRKDAIDLTDNLGPFHAQVHEYKPACLSHSYRNCISRAENPRKEFFYFNDDGNLVALRYDNFKIVFEEQRSPGTLALWAEPFTPLPVPKLFNLRMDPYERADITSNTYYDWFIDHVFVLVPAQAIVGQFLATFKEFPSSQASASFSIDKVVEKLQQGATDGP